MRLIFTIDDDNQQDRKRSLLIQKFYPRIFLEGMRKSNASCHAHKAYKNENTKKLRIPIEVSVSKNK
jgi:hypothetical protein